MALLTLAPSNANAIGEPQTARIDRLTIFAFLWACQALVHQEFYSAWLHAGNPLGWLVTMFALATLLRPGSLVLFVALLASSIAYNFQKWPFVVNHILLESLINVTILAAIAKAHFSLPESATRAERREAVYHSFAPVLWAALAVMYAFAFVAKLNWDFINPEVSCVVSMYGDLLRRFPFLPDNPSAHLAVIGATLLVEAAIPLLLIFPRTRKFGVLIGLPFHFVLGLVGHRTFSALAYALYALCCMDGLVRIASRVRWFVSHRLKVRTIRRITFAGSVVIVGLIGTLIACDLAGVFRAQVAGLKIYQIPWLIWIGWSMAISTIYGFAIYLTMRNPSRSTSTPSVRPGILWAVLSLVFLNGFSQYLGFKTETCFTMYSNLRTEGEWNNHMFMPALRLASYQDDLVEITATNHPELEAFVGNQRLVTFFELRRIVNRTERDFHLSYSRNGESHTYIQGNGDRESTQAIAGHAYLLEKLLYFRPVSTEECVPCNH